MSVPYRLELRAVRDDAFDRLVELGALDVDLDPDGTLAALMPDSVAPEEVAAALGVNDITIHPALGRDAESVWTLNPRAVRIGRLRIVPADAEAEPGALRLIDAAAFGTGLHPTTALCLEALAEATQNSVPSGVLDVGTGSGVLALAALMLGVPQAVGIDVEDEALRVAAENRRINGLDDRLQLRRGGHQGRLVLSGIPSAVQQDVEHAYRDLGMRLVRGTPRGGWVALVLDASW